MGEHRESNVGPSLFTLLTVLGVVILAGGVLLAVYVNIDSAPGAADAGEAATQAGASSEPEQAEVEQEAAADEPAEPPDADAEGDADAAAEPPDEAVADDEEAEEEVEEER